MIIPDLYVTNDTTVRGELTLKIEGILTGKTTDIEDLYVVNDILIEKDATINYNLYVGGDTYGIDHDKLEGFVEAEHLNLPNTIANVLVDHNASAHMEALDFHILKDLLVQDDATVKQDLYVDGLIHGTVADTVTDEAQDFKIHKDLIVQDDATIKGDIYAGIKRGITGDWTTGKLRFEIDKGIITNIRKFHGPIITETKKYKIANALHDRRIWDTGIQGDNSTIQMGKLDGIMRYGIFRWQIDIPLNREILDASIAYYVQVSQDQVPNSEYWPLDSTNVNPFESGDPLNQYPVRQGDKKNSGTHPGIVGWKKRNITSWIKWYCRTYYSIGKWFGVRFGPGDDVQSNNYYHIRDKMVGDGNEAYIWIKYKE